MAVACSGGPDSMVLLALTQDWALRAGGSVTALIVDHGLRDESAAEAEWAADQAVRLGVSSAILSLAGARHVSNLQARARAGRYGLLFEWCRAHGHLHLLVGHHRDDQSETVRMRAERGSGEDGLAAMAPVHERAHARVLRPLLDFPKARLQATLQARGLSSVSDPSNQDIRSTGSVFANRL
ncbi:MAG: tRNA lysidine(34) synthetase TilS [Rickettsiales bacterium]